MDAAGIFLKTLFLFSQCSSYPIPFLPVLYCTVRTVCSPTLPFFVFLIPTRPLEINPKINPRGPGNTPGPVPGLYVGHTYSTVKFKYSAWGIQVQYVMKSEKYAVWILLITEAICFY